MMFQTLRLNSHAKLIRDSTMKVISTDKMQTADVGGNAKTSQIIDAVKKDIRNKMESMG